MKILITGGKGQLGRSLEKRLKDKYQLLAPGKEELDVTRLDQLKKVIHGFEPDYIIHTAALTDVDLCEINSELAFQINAYGTRNVAVAARLTGARLVYISTNFVFNGQSRIPYQEADHPDPINIYGLSKLLGEEFVKEQLENYYIIRTSWLYGQGGNNFVDRIISLAEREKQLMVAADQYGAPTFTDELAELIGKLIETDHFGVYHITAAGCCSRYDWVNEIIKAAGLDVKLLGVDSNFFSSPARRPEFAVLDNRVLKVKTGLEMADWQEGLNRYLREIHKPNYRR